MNIKINENQIDINSSIITLSDVEEVIKALTSLENSSNIILNINSFSLPSSVIGELNRLYDKGVSITINIKDPVLYELLEALQLNKKFTIRKV